MPGLKQDDGGFDSHIRVSPRLIDSEIGDDETETGLITLTVLTDILV